MTDFVCVHSNLSTWSAEECYTQGRTTHHSYFLLNILERKLLVSVLSILGWPANDQKGRVRGHDALWESGMQFGENATQGGRYNLSVSIIQRRRVDWARARIIGIGRSMSYRRASRSDEHSPIRVNSEAASPANGVCMSARRRRQSGSTCDNAEKCVPDVTGSTGGCWFMMIRRCWPVHKRDFLTTAGWLVLRWTWDCDSSRGWRVNRWGPEWCQRQSDCWQCKLWEYLHTGITAKCIPCNSSSWDWCFSTQ